MKLKQITVRVSPATFNLLESKAISQKEKTGVYLRRIVIDHLNQEARRQADDAKFKLLERLIVDLTHAAQGHQKEMDELGFSIANSLNQIYALLNRRPS